MAGVITSPFTKCFRSGRRAMTCTHTETVRLLEKLGSDRRVSAECRSVAADGGLFCSYNAAITLFHPSSFWNEPQRTR